MIRGIITLVLTGVFCLNAMAQPKAEFENKTIDFGAVMEGTLCKYSYKYKNTGNQPLIISDVSVTCGCTVPRWSKNPLQPGDTSSIYIDFDTHNKIGSVAKGINLTNNSSDPLIGLIILATVVPDSNFKPTIDSTRYKFIKLIDHKNFFEVVVPVKNITKNGFTGNGQDLERIARAMITTNKPGITGEIWYSSAHDYLAISTYNKEVRNTVVELLKTELSKKKRINFWKKKAGI